VSFPTLFRFFVPLSIWCWELSLLVKGVSLALGKPFQFKSKQGNLLWEIRVVGFYLLAGESLLIAGLLLSDTASLGMGGLRPEIMRESLSRSSLGLSV
jgi:hypothetical protein